MTDRINEKLNALGKHVKPMYRSKPTKEDVEDIHKDIERVENLSD